MLWGRKGSNRLSRSQFHYHLSPTAISRLQNDTTGFSFRMSPITRYCTQIESFRQCTYHGVNAFLSLWWRCEKFAQIVTWQQWRHGAFTVLFSVSTDMYWVYCVTCAISIASHPWEGMVPSLCNPQYFCLYSVFLTSDLQPTPLQTYAENTQFFINSAV